MISLKNIKKYFLHKSKEILFLFSMVFLLTTLSLLSETEFSEPPYTVSDVNACGAQTPFGSPFHFKFENPTFDAVSTPCSRSSDFPCCSGNPCGIFSLSPDDLDKWYIELTIEAICKGQTTPSVIVLRNNNFHWQPRDHPLGDCKFDVYHDFYQYQEPVKLKLTFIEKCHLDDQCKDCDSKSFKGIRNFYIAEQESFIGQGNSFEFKDFSKAGLWRDRNNEKCFNCN